MLGLSPEYQTLVHWYFQPGGSDFLFYLSAFYPHLSTDASRDFSYGFFCLSLCSPFDCFLSSSSGACPSGLFCCVCLSSAYSSSSSPSILSSFFWCSSGSSSFLSLCCAGVGCVRGAFYGWVFVCSSCFPSCFRSFLCASSFLTFSSSCSSFLGSTFIFSLFLGSLCFNELQLQWLVLLQQFLYALRWLRILRLLSFAPLLSLSLRQCPLPPLPLC